MATKKTYIEHDGRRYELRGANCRNSGWCPNSCSFRKLDGNDEYGKPDYCTKKCYLPQWFQNLQIPDAWLVKACKPCGYHMKKKARSK